jgi:hypothetical protein
LLVLKLEPFDLDAVLPNQLVCKEFVLNREVIPSERTILMNSGNQNAIRTSLAVAALIVIAVSLAVVKTTGQTTSTENSAAEKWEYLAVAGPGTTNFTPTGNPKMRKEPNVPFGREGFVLEQHLDKLGANGWELITVAGSPNDPVYYFKRRK